MTLGFAIVGVLDEDDSGGTPRTNHHSGRVVVNLETAMEVVLVRYKVDTVRRIQARCNASWPVHITWSHRILERYTVPTEIQVTVLGHVLWSHLSGELHARMEPQICAIKSSL